MSGVVTAVAVSVAVYAPVAAAVGATILGSTIVASAVTGAIVGGIAGMASAAVTGQNIGEAALKGAIFGGVTGGLSNALTGGTYTGSGLDEAGKAVGGEALLPSWAQVGTSEAGKAFATGIGTFGGGEAIGMNRNQALEAGLLAGGSQYLANKLFPGDTTQAKFERGLAQSGIKSGLRSLLDGGGGAVGASQGPQGGSAPPLSPAIGGQESSVGSAALAQALRVGDAGAPLFGSSGDEKGKPPTGWNTESLRYMG